MHHTVQCNAVHCSWHTEGESRWWLQWLQNARPCQTSSPSQRLLASSLMDTIFDSVIMNYVRIMRFLWWIKLLTKILLCHIISSLQQWQHTDSPAPNAAYHQTNLWKGIHSNTWSEFTQSWQLTSLSNQNKALFCENVYFYNPEFGNVLNLVTSVNCVVFLVGAIQIS